MGDPKERNRGTLPCMVCGDSMSYLDTNHMQTHAQEHPQTVPAYRDWVADHAGIERSHPAIDSNQLLKPQLWRENEALFEGWRDWG